MDLIKKLENNYLSIAMYCDGSADITDKSSTTRWRMGPVAIQEEGPVEADHVWMRNERSLCEQYPGRFRVKEEGEYLKYTLLGRERQEVGTFTCEAVLEGKWFTLKMVAIDESLPSLVFPPPIESESLVIPLGVGRWVRKPFEKRFIWPMYSNFNMRWFGGLNGDNGWMAILDDGYFDAGILAVQLSLSPLWMKSLNRWQGVKSVRYTFTGGGYVGLAKTYRQWAVEHGLHRSLNEKMEECPALENFCGSRIFSLNQASLAPRPENMEDLLRPVTEDIKQNTERVKVNFTHAETLEAFSKLQAAGVEKGAFIIRGWIDGGYDAFHPDVWPPEPALGSVDELRAVCEAAAGSFTTGFHDNYQDIYRQSPSWPKGVNITKDGRPMAGGIWGGAKQAYIINSRNSMEYAKRNWQDIKTLKPRLMFIDTVTAERLKQSYEEGNTLTRAEDIALKAQLLEFYKNEGMVLGSEEVADFGAPYIDWFENRHRRVAGESIPLWPLVYHDAAFCARYAHGASPVERLTDLLWGYMLLTWLRDKDGLQKYLEDLVHTRDVDRWHERIGTDEMTDHRYLTEDFEVEMTTFSSGVSIVVNFSDTERVAEGMTIPGKSYLIKE